MRKEKECKKYKIIFARSAYDDIKGYKKYIIETFKYKAYANNHMEKIKRTVESLMVFPYGYKKTGYKVNGYDVYLKPYDTYFIFYFIKDEMVVIIRILKDRMYWQRVLRELTD